MKIVESPREGMQGLGHVIPTRDKVAYIQTLLQVGFDTIELGSIVSPKLVPQMADTLEVIRNLDISGIKSNRMVLTVSKKGAEAISAISEITHISYPFSVSPTFLKLNLNSDLENTVSTVGEIFNICLKTNKQLVVYLSMAFGNPYGDEWNPDILFQWVSVLKQMGISIIPLSNVSIEIDENLIRNTFSRLIPEFTDIEFGLHLHTSSHNWNEKVKAAWESGCRRFDSVIHGYGGCPMSGKALLGNLKTENLIAFFENKHLPADLDQKSLAQAYQAASEIFVNKN